MSITGFILTAVGSAVGLGNIWGFPTKMMDFGGPAFLLAYIVAVFILGLPILILEMNLGNKWRKTPVTVFENYLGAKGRYFGWFQTTIQLLIGTYYAVIMTWVLASAGTTFFSDFGKEEFFIKEILGETIDSSNVNSFASLGKIQPVLLFLLVGIFVLAGIIIGLGVKKGIEKANKIMIPSLFFLIVCFAIYGLTLKGADKGIELIFKPDFEKILSPKAWAGAFGQAFFSLSLVVAVMIVYSAKKPTKSDNGNEALIIMSGDTLIALLASVIIGTTLGYSDQEGIVKIVDNEVFWTNDSGTGKEIRGSGFIFKVFPQMFQNINLKITSYLGSILGLLFYIALFFAAMSSLIGLIEPTVAALIEKNNIKRINAVCFAISIQFFFGLIFLFQNGNNLMNDATDTYFVTYLMLLSAILEISIFIFKRKKLEKLIAFHNKNSWIKLGKWFYYLLIFCLFLLLGVTFYGIYDNIADSNSVFNKTNAFKWGVTSLFFFLPFIVLMSFGYQSKKQQIKK